VAIVSEEVFVSFQDFALDLEEDKKNRSYKLVYLIGVAVLLLLAIVYFAFSFFSATESSGVEVTKEQDAQETQASKKIYVHVAGEVNAPGLIELDEGARVSEAITLAGDATEDANVAGVNLAKKCEDGEQIIVPKKAAEGDAASSGDGAASSGASSATGKVNINTADSAELQTISGIGPSKAQKIIDYRTQNGSFKSVDDLTNVSGIGDKTLASIRDQICV
ncbi:MAG: helix-hairpin-helix domain-containing protein, partial [Phoenicibacter congonensis]|nr:helix-hairpin-helix domain-containing protein [Phoenicibacter congonensis]